MKKFAAIALMLTLAGATLQAQDIIKGLKNQATLVKGSRALPTVKFKDGVTLGMANSEDGMTFTMTKNGKQTPLFDPVEAKFGQLAEADIDGDGKMELIAAYRKTDNDFTINVYKKPDYEFDYVLWSTINGNAFAEFGQDGTVKLHTREGSVSVMRIDSEGKMTPMK